MYEIQSNNKYAAIYESGPLFLFSLGEQSNFQAKKETLFMQNFGGQTKTIMVFLKAAYMIQNYPIASFMGRNHCLSNRKRFPCLHSLM